MKILVGFVTYGNWKYTSMMLDSLKEAIEKVGDKYHIDVIGVVGKPDDEETVVGLQKRNISFFRHSENLGFPYSLNDIYHYGFVTNDFDYVIILGNDILLQEHAILNLIDGAIKDNYDFLSGLETSIDCLISLHPQAKKYFDLKNNKKFLGNSLPDWGKVVVPSQVIVRERNSSGIIGDTFNCALFSKKVFDSIGYVDVEFYPAYFSDNDYGKRMQLAKMKMGNTNQVLYFHFWSRTIYEENMKKTNDKYFPLNEKFYKEKWGGNLGKETKLSNIKITSRKNELEIIKKWKSL